MITAAAKPYAHFGLKTVEGKDCRLTIDDIIRRKGGNARDAGVGRRDASECLGADTETHSVAPCFIQHRLLSILLFSFTLPLSFFLSRVSLFCYPASVCFTLCLPPMHNINGYYTPRISVSRTIAE